MAGKTVLKNIFRLGTAMINISFSFQISIKLFLLLNPFREPQFGNLAAVCQSALNFDPLSASNIDPPFGTVEVVPVVHRGDPRGFV